MAAPLETFAREALSRAAERQISEEEYEAVKDKALTLGLVVKGLVPKLDVIVGYEKWHTMKILNWIIISILMLVLPLDNAYASEFGAEAAEKGEYLTCPDGSAAANGIFFSTRNNFWSMDWGRSESRRQVDGISAQIFIGKPVGSYTEQEVNAIFNKFLYSQIRTPLTYESESIGYDEGSLTTQMTLKNSAGKKIRFSGYGTYGSITDSQGSTFEKETIGTAAAAFCPTGQRFILRRIVENLRIKATDQYGRTEDLPLIIMVTNFYIRKENSSMQNIPGF